MWIPPSSEEGRTRAWEILDAGRMIEEPSSNLRVRRQLRPTASFISLGSESGGPPSGTKVRSLRPVAFDDIKFPAKVPSSGSSKSFGSLLNQIQSPNLRRLTGADESDTRFDFCIELQISLAGYQDGLRPYDLVNDPALDTVMANAFDAAFQASPDQMLYPDTTTRRRRLLSNEEV